MIRPDGSIWTESRTSGSRPATKVRVVGPSSRRGQEGILVEVRSDTPFVRFLDGAVLPFGFSDLEALR